MRSIFSPFLMLAAGLALFDPSERRLTLLARLSDARARDLEAQDLRAERTKAGERQFWNQALNDMTRLAEQWHSARPAKGPGPRFRWFGEGPQA